MFTSLHKEIYGFKIKKTISDKGLTVLLSCRCDCKSAKFCIIKGHDLYGSLYIITETQINILLNEIKTLPTAKPQNPDYNTILIKAKHEV